jgi:predicted TIM-barrel fold metal-dependent hydrolase
MIDTNVTLFRYPFRRLIEDDPETLAERLRAKGVSQAWAGSFEAPWCRDMSGVNIRLAETCRRTGEGFFLPFGCVNPKLPDWSEDLRRCHEVHHMPGIRLFPNYHGYTLADPSFAELISSAADRNLIVQLTLSMEDTRTQLTVIQPVDPAPLADLLPRLPHLRAVLLNSGGWTDDEAGESMARIRRAENAYFDMAMNEGVGGLARLIAATSPRRVMFGSHSPFFYFESARLKVLSEALPSDQERAVYEGNAQSLLRPKP